MPEEIYVISFGGAHHENFSKWSHVLNLSRNAEGLFFLKSENLVIPELDLLNASYFTITFEEQGLISYSLDDNNDFEGTGLFTTIESHQDYISQINDLTGQNLVNTSCIVEQKSGLTINFESAEISDNELTIATSIQGHWSKDYSLNELSALITFPNGTILNLVDIVALDYQIEDNYEIEILEMNSAYSVILKHKDNSPDFFTISSLKKDFLEISVPLTVLNNNALDFNLVKSTYSKDNEELTFEEIGVFQTENLSLLPRPIISNFSPEEVCAGIKADMSSGNPMLDGFVIIEGTGFHDLDPSDFLSEIPNNYRVEFRREGGGIGGSSSFKITPLPEDYVYWRDDEIKVRVPTAGWEITNNTVSTTITAVSRTGTIGVRNPDGLVTSDNELVVKFANRNQLDLSNPLEHSLQTKMINQSGNGGYYFVFESSFDRIYPQDPSAARRDVIDAFCDWNSKTGVKLEVVEICPPNTVCFPINYKSLASTGSGTVSLAAGLTQPSQFNCSGESVVVTMELTFSDDITDWRPSDAANPLIDRHIILASAYHEIGHLLQLGHVFNNDATMHPLYGNDIEIDIDAIAGGTHVSDISFSTNCSNVLLSGTNSGCTNSTTELNTKIGFNIYPNPTENIIEASFNELLNYGVIEIFDTTGIIRKSKKIESTVERIHIEELPSGVYFFKVRSYDNVMKTVKFLKG